MSATPPFAALPTAPGMARGFVQAALAGWRLGESSDIAELITSELVSNAVAASASVLGGIGTLVIRVCLITDGNVLTIEVWDQAPGIPVLLEADRFAESGRGLGIIDALTSGKWGCRQAISQPGKCVWADIRLHEEPGCLLPGRHESR